MKPITIISISFFFSAWGDRLWTFAVGLYLVKLTPGSLQLAAIYGLVLTATAILFSPVIGDWIDHNNRLRAVRILLLLQNVFVMSCAIFILVYLYRVTSNVNVLKVMQGVIILLGSLANLSGVGEKISVSKDWVVVVCRLDRDMLANANALLRRIDLSVAILAPVGVGLLMTVVSDLAGIVFICTWNVITMFAEYFLLRHVYLNDIHLRQKVNVDDDADEGKRDVKHDVIVDNGGGDQEGVTVSVTSFSNPTNQSKSSNLNFFSRFKTVLSGWKVYQRQPVALAGAALAWLYLTVLGFNAITTSYAYSQGLKEVYVSICFGLGSLLGIAGTFLFPFIRSKIGLPRTGLVGNILQLSMLSLCVMSIWLPGSPSSLINQSGANRTNIEPIQNTTSQVTSVQQVKTLTKIDYTSISVFMTGIILSRAGLWIADLTITQLQQEYVPEEERGTVGGVQFAFNSIFNLLHFIVTICLPYPSQFWMLILMSVFAVMTSFMTYVVFNIRFRHWSSEYEVLD